MLPDLNRLKIFFYIYKYRSVISAANELNITQSAVSQQLKKLESELKLQLFTRLHKQLVPTTSGNHLYDMVLPFVQRLESELPNIRLAHEKPHGCLRIGGPAEFGKKYLPEACAAFQRMFPDVFFELRLDHPDILLPRIKEGNLDFAFADIFMHKGQFSRALSIFSITPVLDEALVLVCSKNYDDVKLLKDHSFDCLKTAQYIAYQPGYPAVKNWFKHHYKKSAPQLNIVLTVENVESVIAAVRHDMGLAVIPLHLIQEEIDKKELVRIRKNKMEIINKISLVQLQDKVPNITEKTFLKYFKSILLGEKAGISSS